MFASHGRFVWYELLTTDPAAAEAYYSEVVGWGTRPIAGPDGPYILFTAGETPVCGMMKQPEPTAKRGVQPAWLGYVIVDDVDAATGQAQHLGAAIHLEPRDIPDVCRLSVVADPQHATIGMMAWSSPPQKEAHLGAALPGRIGWHELLTTDWESGYDFYNTLFGWQKADALAVKDIGTYQVFTAGGQLIGGMFNKPAKVAAPFWLYYFNVADFDAAVERICAHGGQIIAGPVEVSGGSWIVQARDPQGAVFALVGERGVGEQG